MSHFGSELLPQRFWDKVDPIIGTGCWEWIASLSTPGYGNYFVSPSVSNQSAHRVCYQALVGTVPDGLQLDHLCRNRKCVNPSHLEPVTPAENVARGELTRRMLDKTHCPQGHPYAGSNLYYTKQGYRRCKTCHNNQRVVKVKVTA